MTRRLGFLALPAALFMTTLAHSDEGMWDLQQHPLEDL